MKAIALVVVTSLVSAGPAKEAARDPIPAVRTELAPSGVKRIALQDPSEALYRSAGEAMSRGDYTRAAELYASVVERYPSARVAEAAAYNQAFALYRIGGDDRLRAARDVLTRHRSQYPGLARGEPAALRTRICGELARRGDEACAAEVAAQARAAAEPRAVTAVDARAAAEVQATAVARGTRNGSGRTSNGCRAEEDDERIAALNALLQMDAERALPVLETVLARRDACSEILRRKAVFLVSQKRTPRTADLLLNIARNDPDEETREQAVFWLSQVPDERAVDMLQDILRNSREESLQNKALFALSQHRSGRGAGILREFATRDGASVELRGQAIFWLGQRPSAENNEFLRTLYTTLASEELKEKVLFSLSQRRGAGNEQWLMGIFTSEREPVELRKKALFWAGQSGVAVTELIPFYARLTDREMKEQMIFVLAQRREPAAVDKILDIARNDSDSELRRKAIFWLGQSRDPRAQELLLELINR